MAENSKIQWTEATWNPWHGCKKVSDGCKFCYMYRDKEKFGQDPTKVVRSKSNFDAPLRWKDPKVIFTCSWSDWFIDEADQWREEAWRIIYRTRQHTYQILTKRSDRIAKCLPHSWFSGYPNVWLGVSVENDKVKDRVEDLRLIPAAVRFLSIEPLLGRIGHLNLTDIHWVIVGGESGNDTGKYQYRPCELSWIEEVVANCKSQNVPVFVKQLGTHLSKELKLSDRHGGNINEFPKQLQIREFPSLLK